MCSAGHGRASRWIMSVKGENTAARRQFNGGHVGAIRATLVAIPANRPLSGTAVDDDKSCLIVSALDCPGELQVNTFIFQISQTEPAVGVGPEPAGIGSPETQPLQGHHGRSRLPTSRSLVFGEPYFRVKRRILGDDDQMIDGVEAEADNIEIFFLGQS